MKIQAIELTVVLKGLITENMMVVDGRIGSGSQSELVLYARAYVMLQLHVSCDLWPGCGQAMTHETVILHIIVLCVQARGLSGVRIANIEFYFKHTE
jgi:hypothetical protein